jgi:predicted secreted protein
MLLLHREALVASAASEEERMQCWRQFKQPHLEITKIAKKKKRGYRVSQRENRGYRVWSSGYAATDTS